MAFVLQRSVDIEDIPKYDESDDDSPKNYTEEQKCFQTFANLLHTVDADVAVLFKFLGI